MSLKTPRILPHNIEAEQSLLGCLFLNQEAQALCFSKLNSDDFYSNAHAKIFAGMLELFRGNKPVDYVTLSGVLEKNGTLEEVGGISYIVELTNLVPSTANYKEYYDIVKNASTIRRVINACEKSIAYCFENTEVNDILQFAEKSVLDISKEYDTSELLHIGEGVTQVISRMETMSTNPDALRGIKTGFPTLDNLTNGFHKGDLILLAARPGIGKSSLAINMCENASLKGKSVVAIFSLEMPMSQIAQRVMCSVAHISMTEASSGPKDTSTWETVLQAKDVISDANMYIDDSSLNTPMSILSKCRRLKHERGLDLVMIDYLQLMKSEGKVESRQQEVSELTRSLKIIARELEVPIIVLSQLSRDIEKREDHTPQLSDLRESGSIEQDADIVMFIDRTNEIDTKDEGEDVSVDQDCSLIIAKHRNGALGRVPLKWAGEYTRFYEPKYSREFANRNKPEIETENKADKLNDEVITPINDTNLDDVF